MVQSSSDSELLMCTSISVAQAAIPLPHNHFNKFLSTSLCLMHMLLLVIVFFFITPCIIIMNGTSNDLTGELAVTANSHCLNERQYSSVLEHLN